jgi:hypothetical protein
MRYGNLIPMRVVRLRTPSRAIALLLLLLSVAGVPHFDQGDRACAPVLSGEHDESKHAFRGPATVDHDHCAICHWTRLPRSAFAPVPPFRSPWTAGVALEQGDAFTHRAPALDRLPARAPPALL